MSQGPFTISDDTLQSEWREGGGPKNVKYVWKGSQRTGLMVNKAEQQVVKP